MNGYSVAKFYVNIMNGYSVAVIKIVLSWFNLLMGLCYINRLL